jgi:glycosyltransferase involved in cell wall biosynthesis
MEHTNRKPSDYKFSIIVPVLNEQGRINSFIDKIKEQDFDDYFEIIIVDGDPQGDTINTIRDISVICITSPKDRGRQMNVGAAVERGEILIFLHMEDALDLN